MTYYTFDNKGQNTTLIDLIGDYNKFKITYINSNLNT